MEIEIKYNGTATPLALGQTAILRCKDKKMKDDAIVIAPDIEVYDGTIDVVNLINVDIYDNVFTEKITIQAEAGMTWREWEKSNYNTIGAWITDEVLWISDSYTSFGYDGGVSPGGTLDLDSAIDPATYYCLD